MSQLRRSNEGPDQNDEGELMPRAVVIGVAIALAPVAAHAQAADAEALFDRADRLMTEGRIAEACDAFESSNHLEPRAGTLIRLGGCREANHQLASAVAAYKEALSRVKDPHKRDIATQKVSELEPRLSYLTVMVPDDSRVKGLTLARNGDRLDPTSWNRSLPVDGGSVVITARAPEYDVWVTNLTVPIEGGKLTVDVPALIKLVAPAPPVRQIQRVAEPWRWTPKREVAVGVAGAGIAAIAVGAVLGVQAKRLETEAFNACVSPATPCADAVAAQRDLDRGKRRALYANVGFGVGIAGVATGVVLWLLGEPEHERTVEVGPNAAANGAGVTIRGTF